MIKTDLKAQQSILRFAFVIAMTLIGGFNEATARAEEPNRSIKIDPHARLARRVQEIRQANRLDFFKTPEQWNSMRPQLVLQLQEMLGLLPMPEKTDLVPVITGQIEEGDIVVERIHFQSRPGLYVTANLYRPKVVKDPLPAILYVCGHGKVAENGVSFGNKTYYRHHGLWLASHGYVAMLIDTIQLGEIEGIHHGTYNLNRWDWPARGYTPAGVEAWNAIRAVDYLVSRPEVDSKRIGITGRSGGGAYSWYAAALDERIQVAIPVAGITDLEDHVVDRCVTGHCDCMYPVNIYGWDFGTLAALVAPRALMIGNTDRDPIFPLDGVFRVQQEVAGLYATLNATNRFAIQWTTGGHDDTPELQVGCRVFLDRFLKGTPDPIRDAAEEKRLTPQQLKVFDRLPVDEKVTSVSDWFVPMAQPTSMQKGSSHDAWKKILRERIDGRTPWPTFSQQKEDREPSPKLPIKFEAKSGSSRANYYLLEDRYGSSGIVETNQVALGDSVEKVVIDFAYPSKLDETGLPEWNSSAVEQVKDLKTLFVRCYVEGSLPSDDTRNRMDGIQLRRSYILAGWTLEGRQIATYEQLLMWVEDFCPNAKIHLKGEGLQACSALHALVLSEIHVEKTEFISVPKGYCEGYPLLGVLRHFDIPQLVEMAKDSVKE